MKLIYDVPGRPQDRLALQHGDRRDSDDPIVHSGETFEVSDKRARELLAQLHPTVRQPEPDSEAKPVDTKPKRARKRRAPKTAVNTAVKTVTPATPATKPAAAATPAAAK